MSLGWFIAALVIVAGSSAYATYRIMKDRTDWQDWPEGEFPRVNTANAPFHCPPDVEPVEPR